MSRRIQRRRRRAATPTSPEAPSGTCKCTQFFNLYTVVTPLITFLSCMRHALVAYFNELASTGRGLSGPCVVHGGGRARRGAACTPCTPTSRNAFQPIALPPPTSMKVRTVSFFLQALPTTEAEWGAAIAEAARFLQTAQELLESSGARCLCAEPCNGAAAAAAAAARPPPAVLTILSVVHLAHPAPHTLPHAQAMRCRRCGS